MKHNSVLFTLYAILLLLLAIPFMMIDYCYEKIGPEER